jgi:hypothetical protein
VGDGVKVVYLNQLNFLRTLACKVTGGFLLVVLASCGGNSSNDSGGTAATQLQGYYLANIGGSDFITLVLPAVNGVAPWYGWYFRTGGNLDHLDPYLYSGNLVLGVNGAAQSIGTNLKVSASGTLKTLDNSAIFSQASSTGFQAIATTNTQQTINFNATAQPVLQTTLNGTTWQGYWSSRGDDLNTLKSISFSAPTTMDSFASCKINPNELQLTPRAGDLYDASIILRSDAPGVCLWVPGGSASVTLEGIGFIHTSPVAGKKRLELMFFPTTSGTNGSGISFRGDM